MNQDNESTSDDRLNQILAEYLQAVEAGQPPDEEKLLEQYPEFADQLREFFADKRRVDQIAKPGAEEDQVPPQTSDTSSSEMPTIARTDAQGVREAETLPPSNDSQSPISNPQSQVGTRVRYFGDYELLEEIARGGMGVVYKARQVKLNRVVAIKMILAGQLASKEDVQRFYTEAEAAAGLDHPGIVPIFEVGEHEGQHYFSMGFVDGESLASELSESPLAPRDAAELVRSVAEAVQYAHDKGVIHRDLKPANVLIDKNGQPKVTDFGLAKQIKTESGMTATGQILGTPSYMPPEQAAGRLSEVRETADVYALGAVLYATLTGRPPFQADNPLDTLMQVLEREPISPRQLNPSVPRDLETICFKCLEKDRRRRYESASSLGEELQRFIEGHPILARPISRPARAWRWCRRNPVVATLTVAVALLLVTGTVVSSYFAIQAHERAVEERKARFDADVQRDKAVDAAIAQRKAKEAEAKARQDADVQRDKAVAAAIAQRKAREAETEARREAERERDRTERSLYVANMRLSFAAMEAQEFQRGADLLDIYRPKSDRPDLRGWEWFFLNSMYRSEIVSTHDVAVPERANAVAWSPKTSHLAVVGAGGVVTIWDESTGQKFRTLDNGRAVVVAYHPHAAQLAVGQRDGMITIWNLENDEIERQFQAHRTSILSLAFHPDGTQLVSGCAGGHVAIHDAAAAKSLGSFRIAGAVRSVAWSPDGKRIAAGSSGRQAKVWEVENKQEVLNLEGYKQPIFAVAWSPEGTHLAVSGWAGSQVWDIESRQEVERLRIGEVSGRSCCWSPDGRMLAVGSEDWAIRVLDDASGKTVRTMRSHNGFITALAWSSDSRYLASAGTDGTVKVHDMEPQTRERELRGSDRTLWSVAWSPDGQRVAACGEDKSCRIWNVSTGEVERTISGFDALIRWVSWNPDSTRLALASYDTSAKVFDASTGEQLVRLEGINAWPTLAVWSSDGEQLVSAYWDGTLQIHDATTGRVQRTIRALTGRCNCAVWSPDGRYVASCGTDKLIRLWDAASDRLAATLRGHSGSVAYVAWSPDGTVLASAGGDGAIKLWDVREQRELATLRGHSAAVFQLAWHRDGRRLASASADQTWKLWELESAQNTLTVRPEVGALYSICWSPDGRQIAAAGVGGTVRVWDASLGYDELQPTATVPLPKPENAAVLLVNAFEQFSLKPRRQGPRNTCSVFVVTEALEFALSKKRGHGVRLSPEYLNWACNQLIDNQTEDRGQFFHDLLKGLERYGICQESDMPYKERFDPEYAPSSAARTSAQRIRDVGFDVQWINPWSSQPSLTGEQIEKIKSVLAAGWPVAAGSSHSLLLVGYRDDSKKQGGGVFVTLDSAAGGFREITYDALRTGFTDIFWVEQ